MSARTVFRRTMISAALSCVVAACVLTGCGGPAPDPLPEGVEASLVQQRSDVAGRQAQLRIRNGSDSAVAIGEVSIADPRFVEPAQRVVDRTSVLAPGGSVDVRIQLAPVDCDAADAATSTLTLHYVVDGATGVGVAPVEEQVPFLTALHAAECLRERVDEVAEITFGRFTPSPAESPATLELVIAGTGTDAGTLKVRDIRETNLLGFVHGEPQYAVEKSGDVTVGLPLIPARCDPHAVQEDKRGTVFRVDVALDGVEGSFDLAATPELRADILSWVADWCGYGSDA